MAMVSILDPGEESVHVCMAEAGRLLGIDVH